ncbi:hypothetical protein AYO43_08940 [Nitrospira sp. SCGC AG-212-E16]|nr:hypothetical protein AYO43_08940 [Nitrospira sp. SCGC AG-212-E16]
MKINLVFKRALLIWRIIQPTYIWCLQNRDRSRRYALRKHTPAISFTILLLFLAQPAFPQDTPAAESAHPKEIEIMLAPGSITSIRVHGSSPSSSEFGYRILEDLHRKEVREKARQLLTQYKTPLPYAYRFSEDQLRELRNDQTKLDAVSSKQMHELLGEQQFYLWDELRRGNDMIEDQAEKANEVKMPDINFYHEITFDLKSSPQGIQSLTYTVASYIDAKAIIEGLQQGAIKSVLVESENRSWQENDTKEWVVCKKNCGIKAFIY